MLGQGWIDKGPREGNGGGVHVQKIVKGVGMVDAGMYVNDWLSSSVLF